MAGQRQRRSVLELSGLTTLTLSTQFDTRINVEALAGGQMELPDLGQIVDPSSVNIGARGALLTADSRRQRSQREQPG